jgi:hypothetical protein
MTGPAREDMPFSDDIDTPRKDAWEEPDMEVPTDVEDIAIVCHEALRAFRTTQGSGSGFPWMHRTANERRDMIAMVQRYMAGGSPDETLIGPQEALLVQAIVRTLKP